MKLRLWVFLYILCSFSWIAPSWADCRSSSNQFIRSLAQLGVHETIHARNVHSLMLTLAQLHPEDYSDIFPYLLGRDGYGSHHDEPKGHADILKGLCEMYGTEAKTTESRAVIEQLRLREEQVERELLFRLKLVDVKGRPIDAAAREKIEKLRRLEKIADNAERLSNPISLFEELGHQVSLENTANRYMKDPKMIAQCKELMAIYRQQSSEFTGYISVIAEANRKKEKINPFQLINDSTKRVKTQIIEMRQRVGQFLSLEPGGIFVPEGTVSGVLCAPAFRGLAK